MNLHRGRAAVYALLALLFGAASYAVGVGSLLGQRAEAIVLEASDFTYDPPIPLSLVSIPSVAVTLLVLALIALWAHGVRPALTVVVFSAAAIVASQMLKQELLVRPELFELDAQNTFPSGHMTVFAALAAAAIWAVPRALKPCIALLGAIVLSVVAWQLLEFGWHRPSDLVGALSLGVLSFSVAALFRTRRGARPVRGVGSIMSVLNRIISVLITVSGIALTVGGIGLTVAAGWFGSPGLMLAGAQIALIGASALCTRALLALSP